MDHPMVFTQMPFRRDLAENGLRFFVEALGLDSETAADHPLRAMYAEVRKLSPSPDLSWGPSKELMLFAQWGIQFQMVKDWPGFDDLVGRVKADARNPFAHLHEASVASMFWLAGCGGEFLTYNHAGPDLKILHDSQHALIECKRSDPLTKPERKDQLIWGSVSLHIARYLSDKIPAAALRIYPKREAMRGDKEYLVDGIGPLVQSWTAWRDSGPPDRYWGWQRFSDPNGFFEGLIVLSEKPDEVFDSLAEETTPDAPGVEVPGDTAAASLILDLTLSRPPKCDGVCYVKIHSRRAWELVEEALLRRLEKKSTQLRSFRESGSVDASLPAVVWIDHPALSDARKEDFNHLRERAAGKLRRSLDAVVFSQSRAILTKAGILYFQSRFDFATRSDFSTQLPEGFPYLTESWWAKALSNGLPSRSVFGTEMRIGKASS